VKGSFRTVKDGEAPRRRRGWTEKHQDADEADLADA
jgi:hypothetical protein